MSMPSSLNRNHRPVPLQLRHDLEIVRQRAGRSIRWVIKDPLTIEFFQLDDREYQLVRLLDGQRSMQQIKQLYEQRFPHDRLSSSRFHTLCLALRRDGLLAGPTQPPAQLIERRRKRSRAQWLERLTNVLAVRFRGIDPDPLLNLLYPLLRWCFSPAVVAAGIVAAATVFLFVLIRFDLFQQQLPNVQTLFTGPNMLLLMAALFCTKVAHELAHGLTCKHFGGQCREMGAMLLVFTPCLYCDVSDAWLLSHRWKRIAISAAGMYVEMLLAAFCLVLWWFAREGPIRLFLLHTVLVCTVATLVFNANPLLRFDGYYILSDALGISNLWSRSQAALNGLLKQLCLGTQPPADTDGSPRSFWPLAGYAAASALYKLVVLVGIVWLLVGWLKPWGLDALAYLAAAVVLSGVLLPPLVSLLRMVSDPLTRRRVNRWRLSAVLLLGLAGGLLLLLVPLPHAIRATASIRLDEAFHVVAPQASVLVESIEYGAEVQEGDLLLVLSDPELERRLLTVRGQYARQREQVAALLTLRGSDPNVSAEIPPATEILNDYQQRLLQLEGQQQSLTLRAPRSGTLLPPETWSPSEQELRNLPWRTAPLDPARWGTHVAAGEHLGQLGNPRQIHAEALLRDDQIEQVAIGQLVELRLAEAPAHVVRGRVADISPANREELERSTAPEQSLQGERYQVRIELDAQGGHFTVGARGRVSIRTPGVSLARRIQQATSRLFNFGG